MYKLKVIAVDDEPDILELLATTLEGDYNFIPASCGKEFLEKAKKEIPDIIILDYNLPDISGVEICSVLRKDPFFLNVPILMLTGKGEVEDKVSGLEAGVDDYMVKPFDPQELLARLRMLVRRSNINLDANPLTRLPGNASINRELKERIISGNKFAVLYIDIDNFKALNDYYGFDRGDRVIKDTARILIENVQKYGTTADFLGHIGGDDFVIITSIDNAEKIAKNIITCFDNIAPNFFDEEDRIKGYIETKARDNTINKFSFPSLSIGITSNANVQFKHVAQISSLGAEMKSFAKKFAGSKYIFDRRGSS